MDIVKDYFKDVVLDDETHIYTVKGKKLDVSVSKLLKKFVKYVDYDLIAKKIDERDNKTVGTTSKEWKKIADVACDDGTNVHIFGETYPFKKHLKIDHKKKLAIKKFWSSLPDYIIIASLEQKMYHKKYMFGGTADILLYNTKTGKYIIADYKTNKNLFKNFNNKRLLVPFDKLLENDYNKYQLQLNFYQILVEQCGIEIEKRVIVWLKDDGNYKMYNCDNYTKELKSFLKTEYYEHN